MPDIVGEYTVHSTHNLFDCYDIIEEWVEDTIICTTSGSGRAASGHNSNKQENHNSSYHSYHSNHAQQRNANIPFPSSTYDSTALFIIRLMLNYVEVGSKLLYIHSTDVEV